MLTGFTLVAAVLALMLGLDIWNNATDAGPAAAPRSPEAA